ncbi:MAG: nascent polypeptide-associated complex protein [Desulfurococcales archaeon]|nr:nascent polypeptide-associated complex protein [Desulfurococcales archaeon]
MFGFNPRDMRRVMRQLGIRMEELRAVRVTIELDDGRIMVIEEPVGSFLMRQKGQPPMIYIVGEPRIEEPSKEETPEISEEDVLLVAEQAGVSPEEARKALEETGGDIAEAILRLQEKKG